MRHYLLPLAPVLALVPLFVATGIVATVLGWLCYAGAVTILLANWGRVSYALPTIERPDNV